MSISTQIDRIKNAVETAYAKLKSKGATVPEQQTLDNLPACIDSIPSIADANAEIYDIYNGKTAIGANGELITGAYIGYTRNLTSSDLWSSTTLSMPCPFEPSGVVVTFLSGTISSYTVLDLVVWKDQGLYDIGNNELLNGWYCGHSTGATSSSKFAIQRHQLEYAKHTDLLTYDGTNVHIKSPSSTYTFKNSSYRVIAFK